MQLTGRVRVHHDPAWLRNAVDVLTIRHESHRRAPWATTDAPDKYIDGQLRAIVGLEIQVESVRGKAKLSQNRSVDDQRGVITGLRQETAIGATAIADDMQHRQEQVEQT